MNTRVPIDSMPGIERLSVDLLLRQVEADLELGLRPWDPSRPRWRSPTLLAALGQAG